MIKSIIFKRIALAVIIICCVLFYFNSLETRSVDIVKDLAELRNQPLTGAGLELNNYYKNLELVDSFVSKGEFENAISMLKSLATKNDNYSSQYFFENGKLLFTIKDYQTAKNNFNEAILRSKSGHPNALYWRSYCYLNLDQLDSALIDATQMLKENKGMQSEFERIKYILDSLSN